MTKKLSLTEHELRSVPAVSRTGGHPDQTTDRSEDATQFVRWHFIRGIEYEVERHSVYPHARAFGRNQISNREFHLLELLASHRKQTTEVRANRKFLHGSLPAAPLPGVTISRQTVEGTNALQIAGEERHGGSWKPNSRRPETNTGLDTLCLASFRDFPLPAILVFNLQPGCAIEPEAITGEEIE
jgi:hypothetical protein